MTSVQEERMSGNVAKMVNRLSKDLSFNRSSDVAFRRPGSGARIANVRFSYKSSQEDELDLEVDDVIEVLEEAEAGWMKGKIRGSTKTGLFPTNFVQFPDSQQGVGNGLTKLSDVKRKITDSISDDSPEASLRTSMVQQAPKPKVPSSFPSLDLKKHDGAGDADSAVPKEMARVLFTYTPTHDDELALKEVGAMVRILSRDCADPGWYLGEADGKRGLIPDNFVELIRPPTLQTQHSNTSSSSGNAGNVSNMTGSGTGTGAGAWSGAGAGLSRKNSALSSKETNSSSTGNVMTNSSSGGLPMGLGTGTAGTNISTATTTTTLVEGNKSAGLITMPTIPPPVVPTKPNKPPGLGISSTTGVRRVSSNAFAATLADALTKPPKTFVGKASRNEESGVSDSKGDERLSHITTSRPKQMNKRPPSTILTRRKSSDHIQELSVSEEVDSTPMIASAFSISAPSAAFTQHQQQPLSVPPSKSEKKHMAKPGGGGGDGEFVTRVEYNSLLSRFEELRSDTNQRLAALEAKLSKQAIV